MDKKREPVKALYWENKTKLVLWLNKKSRKVVNATISGGIIGKAEVLSRVTDKG